MVVSEFVGSDGSTFGENAAERNGMGENGLALS